MNSPAPRKNDPHSTTISVAGGGEPPYDGSMEQRLDKLEAGLAAMQLDVEIIKRTMATKEDVAMLKGSAKVDIAELKAETSASIADLKTETKADIADLKAETKADIAELKAETKADIAELRAEMKVKMAELEAKISEAKSAVIMWVTTAIFLAQLLPSLIKLLTQ